MGLDGISINQLRIAPNKEMPDHTNTIRFNSDSEIKTVDGLAHKQKIDPDRESEHEKQKLNKKSKSNEDETDEEENEDKEEIIKYDLSKSEKYILKLNESTNEILIIEKKTEEIVQRINSDALLQFINYLPSAQGAIINRKF